MRTVALFIYVALATSPSVCHAQRHVEFSSDAELERAGVLTAVVREGVEVSIRLDRYEGRGASQGPQSGSVCVDYHGASVCSEISQMGDLIPFPQYKFLQAQGGQGEVLLVSFAFRTGGDLVLLRTPDNRLVGWNDARCWFLGAPCGVRPN
jgi:hypothetical protein